MGSLGGVSPTSSVKGEGYGLSGIFIFFLSVSSNRMWCQLKYLMRSPSVKPALNYCLELGDGVGYDSIHSLPQPAIALFPGMVHSF